MQKKKSIIINERMLQLCAYVLDNGLAADVDTFYKKMGFDKNNLSNLRSGKMTFTHNHVLSVAKEYAVNINWIYGLEINMFRVDRKLDPIQLLKAATIAVENKFGGKK